MNLKNKKYRYGGKKIFCYKDKIYISMRNPKYIVGKVKMIDYDSLTDIRDKLKSLAQVDSQEDSMILLLVQIKPLRDKPKSLAQVCSMFSLLVQINNKYLYGIIQFIPNSQLDYNLDKRSLLHFKEWFQINHTRIKWDRWEI